jgi:DNA repair exonuclease SbcCD ATPase subunit
MFLDEPFKFVSAGHRTAVRGMIEGLARDLTVQFIMVTHINELRCGKIIELEGDPAKDLGEWPVSINPDYLEANPVPGKEEK